MRSRCIIFLLLLTCLTPLHASRVTHLHLGIGNDFYTMGLGDNLDDGLSFGSHFMLAIQDKVFFKLDALGFTDRFATASRYDQINMNIYAPLTFLWGDFITVLTPLVGVSLEGDFGFNKIQNSLHNSIGSPALTLLYDSTETNAHPNLGSTIQTMFPLGWVKIGLEASYLHTFGWENSTQTLAVIKLGSSLTIKGGFSFMHNFTNDPTHQTMMERMSGPTFSYYFDGGLVTNAWIFHSSSGSSYGVFGIDVMQLFQPSTYDHSDFTYSMGALYDMIGHQNRSFSLAFGPSIIQIQNKSGPMKDDNETPHRRMTVASWMMGYQKEWKVNSLIYPYLKTLGGFQRFNLKKSATNILGEELETIRATIALETGIKFGSDGLWVAKNNSYRPRISAAIQYVFDAKSITTDTFFAKYVGPWTLLLGIGLDIGHHPH